MRSSTPRCRCSRRAAGARSCCSRRCARSRRRANGSPTRFARAGSTSRCSCRAKARKTELLERFRELGNAVLLGSASFWEGVDVPGAALSLVVIDKLPFAPPDDPLLAARLERLRARAAIRSATTSCRRRRSALKQGAGRLIRTETDRGVLMICDPRLTEKPYGKRLWRSLPPMRRTRNVSEAVELLCASTGIAVRSVGAFSRDMERFTMNTKSLRACARSRCRFALPQRRRPSRPRRSTNFSDLWWTPAESGWGVNVAQQADVMFLTFYVFGPTGQPILVHGAARRPGTADRRFHAVLRQPVPVERAVLRRPVRHFGCANTSHVGSASFRATSTTAATLTYVVGNVTVVKADRALPAAHGQLHRRLSRRNVGRHVALRAERSNNGFVSEESGAFTVAHVGTVMEIRSPGCTYTGSFQQQGQVSRFDGNYTCTNGAIRDDLVLRSCGSSRAASADATRATARPAISPGTSGWREASSTCQVAGYRKHPRLPGDASGADVPVPDP